MNDNWLPPSLAKNKNLRVIMKITRSYPNGIDKLQKSSLDLNKTYRKLKSGMRVSMMDQTNTSKKRKIVFFAPESFSKEDIFENETVEYSEKVANIPQISSSDLSSQPEQNSAFIYSHHSAIPYPTFGPSRFYNSFSINNFQDCSLNEHTTLPKKKVDKILHVGHFRPSSSTKSPKNFAKYHGLV